MKRVLLLTTEAAVTKLMWALGQTEDLTETRALSSRGLAGERSVQSTQSRRQMAAALSVFIRFPGPG